MGRFLLRKFLHADVCVASCHYWCREIHGTPTSLASGSGHLHVDIPIGEIFALEDIHQVYLGEEVESLWYH